LTLPTIACPPSATWTCWTADDLREATGPKERLKVLMTNWEFRLATASDASLALFL
jgi:hypothetical protein